MKTTTKPTVKRVTIHPESQPFHNEYTMKAVVEGTSKGTVELPLLLKWESGRYSYGRKTRLSIVGSDSSYDRIRLQRDKGIVQVAAVAGLSAEAMRVAKDYRDSFKPTVEQATAMALGDLDSIFIVAVKGSNRASIEWKGMDFGKWRFAGQATIQRNDKGEAVVTMNERGYNGDHLKWLGSTRDLYEPGILDSAKQVIVEYITPAALRWWVVKGKALHAKAIEETEKLLVSEKQQLEFARGQVKGGEKTVAELERKLAELREKDGD